jgi:hypothetical protein
LLGGVGVVGLAMQHLFGKKIGTVVAFMGGLRAVGKTKQATDGIIHVVKIVGVVEAADFVAAWKSVSPVSMLWR